MKRDMDLVRKILQQAEDSGGQLAVEGFDVDTVRGHAKLLREAGMLEFEDRYTDMNGAVIINRLTWAGHDFLDAARDETVWQKAKAKIQGAVVSVPLEVFKSVLVDTAKGMILG